MFRNYAELYDSLYLDRSYISEVNYLHKIIKEDCNPNISLLDLGCGTGIHSLELSKFGFKVTGLDISPEMLSVANNKLTEISQFQELSCEFVIGDILKMKMNKKYDVVISMFHVMNFFLTNENFVSVLKSIYDALKEDGIFIFDTWNGNSVSRDSFTPRSKEFDFQGKKYLRTTQYVHDSISRIVDVNFEFYNINENKIKVSEFDENHKVRYFLKDEILKFISNRFRIESVVSSKSFNEAQMSDWSIIYVLKKI